MIAAALPVIVKPLVFTLIVGPEYVPGATLIVSPGAASLMAFWIAVVLPVGATLIVRACAVAGSTQHAMPTSANTNSLAALRCFKTMSIPSLRCVRMAQVVRHAQKHHEP
jgi:hypothetical protein